MFCLNDTMRYWLCPGRTDMRKGISSLCGVVHERMKSEVRNGDVFIFIGRDLKLMRYNLTIGIAIYDDRIEIENPGILPPQITPENIRQPHISYPYNPLIANVLYSTTYIENWGSGVKRIMEACQKRSVAAPTWSINGGFVVVTFMRPKKSVTQDVTQGVTHDVTQKDTLDIKIEKAIKENLNVTTEDLAKQFGVTSMTIKRHLAKMPHIRYVGSGYSGHWEVLDKE